jgi:hypothetical protein
MASDTAIKPTRRAGTNPACNIHGQTHWAWRLAMAQQIIDEAESYGIYCALDDIGGLWLERDRDAPAAIMRKIQANWHTIAAAIILNSEPGDLVSIH